MTLSLSTTADRAREQQTKEPLLAVKIEGIDTVYSSGAVGKYWQIGDPEVINPGGGIGLNGIIIGGIVEILDQEKVISMQSGTSTRLTQQLQAEDGKASVSSMQLAMIDKNEKITQLISPGIDLDDILGKGIDVYLGFSNVGFQRDYIRIHSGIIDDIESSPGLVLFNVAHPDQLKRQDIFRSAETTADEAINGTETSITVDDTSQFLETITGPSGGTDSTFETCFRVDDEIIKYAAISGNTFTGCTRGHLGTTATTHDNGTQISSRYRITGTMTDIAQKIMMSGFDGPYAEDVAVTNFRHVSATENLENVIYFDDVNVAVEYGVFAGDYITTTGASNGANNVTLEVIQLVVEQDDGSSYIEVTGQTFVTETDSAAVIDFRSQYDVYPDGLQMKSKYVDMERHDFYKRTFLSNFDYDFLLDSEINGKEFIDSELYKPASAFSLPRQGQSSLGYHSPPIPGTDIRVLTEQQVTNPDKIKLKRSVNKKFFNSIVYKLDPDHLEGKYLQATVDVNSTSLTRIPIGNKTLQIESKGLRSSALAGLAAGRRLDRYKFGAEVLKNVELKFEELLNEAGDIIVFDPTNLKISNTADGTRSKPEALVEIENRIIDIAGGRVIVDIVYTTFDGASVFGLISPSSCIKTGTSTTQFIIEQSFASRYGTNEYKKWEKWIGTGVIVRSPDHTTRYDTSVIDSIAGNTVTLSSALSFTPLAGDIMELDTHATATTRVRLIFGFMVDGVFISGDDPYSMI